MDNERKGSSRIGLAAAVLVAGGGFFYYYFHRAAANSVGVPAPQAEAPATPVTPSPAAPAQVLPPIPLEQSDAAIREEAGRRSLGPKVADWLKAENLVRRITAATVIIAEGNSPKESLAPMGPEKGFRVKRGRGRLLLDPASYVRYDPVGDAFQALDARAAADFLRRLMPLFESACREMDCGVGGFQGAFGRAVQTLLTAPVVEGDIGLKRKVVSYIMTDPALEGLNAAQKHLVRMGPKNTSEIQSKLREIARLLGGGDSDLPPTRVYVPKP